MVKIRENLTNQVFERLTVLQRAEDRIMNNGRVKAQWLCRCSCVEQNMVLALGSDLKRGHKKSCGCLAKETASMIVAKRHYVNTYDLDGDYGIGYTRKNEPFWFDKEDYELICGYSWHYNAKGYVEAYDKETKSHITLHRLIMGFPDVCFDVNHKTHLPRNEPKIDNRKSNLEIVTKSQNSMNHVAALNNVSGCSGVHWMKQSNKWRARITVQRKTIHLGVFDNFEDAVKARKEAEVKYFGEYRYDANNE